MPLTPSPAAGPRRRSMLAGTLSTLGPLAALGTLSTVTGCSEKKDSADDAQVTRAEHRMRQEASRQSRRLLERYEATAAAHTGLEDRIRPLRAATERHLKALDGEDDGSKGSGRDGTKSGDSADGEGKGKDGKKADGKKKPAVPTEEKAALAALGDAERRTAQERTAALVKASPELARLLASLAAAGAVHAYLLGADEPDGRGGDT